MLISFVLSFRNELENIPELIKRISKIVIELKKYEYELIFIKEKYITNKNWINKFIDVNELNNFIANTTTTTHHYIIMTYPYEIIVYFSF